MDLNIWNAKIYRDDISGEFVEGGLKPKQFWEEFGIKSGPLFSDCCYYHIPEKWAEDVRLFIKQVQSELKERITFKQIKEKYCYFTVYFDFADEEAKTRVNELQSECITRLKNKGVYPEEDEIINF